MLSKLVPDYMFREYAAITPDFLQACGIRALLMDVDNTLAPYETEEPDEALRAWIAVLTKSGVRLALLSNNSAGRVERFNRTLGLPAYSKARKPLLRVSRCAMQALGCRAEETAVLGDQIFTDLLVGRRMKVRVLIVLPIRDRRDPLTRCKRWLERPFVRAYEKRQHALCPAPESLGSEFRSGMCTKEKGTEMREKNDE